MNTSTVSQYGVTPPAPGPEEDAGTNGTQGTDKPPVVEKFDFGSVMKKIVENMAWKGDGTSDKLSDPPDLKPPATDTRVTLTYLLSQITALFGESSLADLQGRLKELEARAAAQQALAQESQKAFDDAVAEANDALAAYEAAADNLDKAQKALDNARDKLAAAKAALDATTPGTPEHDAAKQAYDKAQSEYDAAKGKYDAAKQDALKAHDAAKDAMKKADDLLDKFLSEHPFGQLNQNSGKDHLDNTTTLIYLMAQLAKLLGDSANDAIQEDMKFFEKIRKAREADMIKKNEEYEEQVKKAEKMNKIFGIFGKILGAVLAVVGVLGAVFTGGMSTTLTVIGVGLMADSIMGAATGFSLVGEAIKPVMTHVVQPLAEKIGSFVGSMLEELGVAKDTAELIGNIVGVVAAAVVVVAAVAVTVAVGGAAAATNMGKMLGQMVGDVVKKLVPDLLREAGKAGSKYLTQNLTAAAAKLGVKEGNAQMLANILRQIVTAGELTNATVQATGSTVTGIYAKNASDAAADMMVSQDTLEKITDSVKQSSDKFAATQDVVTNLVTQMSDAGRVAQESQRFVMNNVRAVV
ncbi:Cell invasion protein SipB [Pandoraea captiosa]|uniref:Translocator protein BipB n=1 Tax=Pandoraea captiosa TaxID=2508302 RepID=A0A5E4ZQL5_9BURK|nr:type III secretion system translocon subunit SctE [Pandoraea captiosa]VVE63649.1 Cell invasion protein SipB [Pandoraea captiosa]